MRTLSPVVALAGCDALLLAKCGNVIIGSWAVMREGDGYSEISKTSVSISFQGREIERRLLLATLDAFKDLCGKKLYLETNTVLTSAIALYVSAGLVHAQNIGATNFYEEVPATSRNTPSLAAHVVHMALFNPLISL